MPPGLKWAPFPTPAPFMKILLAADGSEYTKRAARYIAEHISMLSDRPEIHLLHVHSRLPYPGAAAAAGKKAVEAYQREESEKALAVAEKELRKAGLAFKAGWTVGDVAAEIKDYAKKSKIDMIVMGSHGHTALGNLTMGSVATRVIATSKVPVLVVR